MKRKLDKLIEDEAKIRSNGQEQKFALRHTPTEIHNFIDLIGYTKKEALEITQRRMRITQEELASGRIKPNLGTDHVYKIIAHKGKHSQRGGVLKFAIQSWLVEAGYDCHQDMEHGVFLVRLNPKKGN